MKRTSGQLSSATNVRTSAWLGCFVRRPEMHRLHDEFDRYRGNYRDLPLRGWLFGTLRLPDAAPVRCGFDASRDERIVEMTVFADVHRTTARSASHRTPAPDVSTSTPIVGGTPSAPTPAGPSSIGKP